MHEYVSMFSLSDADLAGRILGLAFSDTYSTAHQLLVGHAVGLISISTLPSPEVRVVLLKVPLGNGGVRVLLGLLHLMP